MAFHHRTDQLIVRPFTFTSPNPIFSLSSGTVRFLSVFFGHLVFGTWVRFSQGLPEAVRLLVLFVRC